jgi:hypothetical protein
VAEEYFLIPAPLEMGRGKLRKDLRVFFDETVNPIRKKLVMQPNFLSAPISYLDLNTNNPMSLIKLLIVGLVWGTT